MNYTPPPPAATGLQPIIETIDISDANWNSLYSEPIQLIAGVEGFCIIPQFYFIKYQNVYMQTGINTYIGDAVLFRVYGLTVYSGVLNNDSISGQEGFLFQNTEMTDPIAYQDFENTRNNSPLVLWQQSDVPNLFNSFTITIGYYLLPTA
jgi:hypothetical protein